MHWRSLLNCGSRILTYKTNAYDRASTHIIYIWLNACCYCQIAIFVSMSNHPLYKSRDTWWFYLFYQVMCEWCQQTVTYVKLSIVVWSTSHMSGSNNRVGTHNQVFLLLSHMLIQNTKSIFIYVMKYVPGVIWMLGNTFAVCIKWIDETWWNNRLLLVPNCYEVVPMIATMVAMVAPLWWHTLR